MPCPCGCKRSLRPSSFSSEEKPRKDSLPKLVDVLEESMSRDASDPSLAGDSPLTIANLSPRNSVTSPVIDHDKLNAHCHKKRDCIIVRGTRWLYQTTRIVKKPPPPEEEINVNPFLVQHYD